MGQHFVDREYDEVDSIEPLYDLEPGEYYERVREYTPFAEALAIEAELEESQG